MVDLKYLLLFLGFLVFTASSATLSRIQKGTVTIGAGSGSVSQAITAVDPTKSFLVFSINTDSNRPGESQIGGRMTSSTILTFDRLDVGGTPSVEIYWQVFEFSAGVTVQRGVETNVVAGGVNVSISAVSLANSFATVNMRKDGGQYGSDDFMTANLTTSTNLYLDREAGGANPQNVYWQVVEWTGASVQKIVTTMSSGVDSLAVTIGTAVDFDKTMIIGTHRSSGNVNADDFPCSELVDGNTVSFSRVGTAANLALVYYVVSFSDNTDVIHGAIRMTAAQNDISTTICSVSAASSGIIPPNNYFRSGSNCENTDDDMAIAYANLSLTSNTSVNAKRAGTGYAAVFPFQVLEFTAATPSGCVPPEPGASTPRTSDLCGLLLPIELLDFKVELKPNQSVEINWSTASEVNNDYFLVERSLDGINYELVNKTSGAGNSTAILRYNTIDFSPAIGLSYYRLKQVDFDGEFSYSDVVSVSIDPSGFSVYPNPTTGKVYLSNGQIDAQTIALYNSVGQRISIQTIPVGHELVLDLSTLPIGIYFLHFNGIVKKISKK